MREVWSALELALIQMLRRPGYLIALLLCPAVILLGTLLLPEEGRETEITVGISFEELGETEQELLARLQEGGSDMVTFCLAGKEELTDRVAAGQWECGYLFPAGLDEGLEAGHRKGLITLVCREGMALQMPVTEMVSAALLELAWDEIGEETLSGLGLDHEIGKPLEEALPEEDWVAVRITAVGGSDDLQKADGANFYRDLLQGIVGLWLFLAALLAGGELAQWLRRPYSRYALPGTGLWPMLLPKWGALTLAALGSGLLSLAGAGGDGKALLGLLLYELTLSALSLALALLPGTEKLLPVLLPVVPLLSVAASPLLVDVSRYLPALGPVSACLPLTGYLRLLREGDWGLLLTQLLALAVLAALLAFSSGLRQAAGQVE